MSELYSLGRNCVDEYVKRTVFMGTQAKPLRSMDIIRQLLAVKKQVQHEAVENHRNNPEVRAVYERLIQKNKENRIGRK